MPDTLAKKLILVIEKEQKNNGSFASYSAVESEKDTQTFATTFLTSLILDQLTHVPVSKLRNITKQASEYILSQKSKQWTWNYWDRSSDEYHEKPYPDDCDDTFCALTALTKYDQNLVSGKGLGTVTTLLTKIESQEGGPYYTWITNDAADHWKDIDPAVNANIQRFLTIHDVYLPNVIDYLEDLVAAEFSDKHTLSSPYYPSSVPILFFISEWYDGDHVGSLVDIAQSHSSQNLLEQALIAILLKNLSSEKAYTQKQKVLSEKLHSSFDEIYKHASFCYDPSENGKKYTAGSPALTAAMCLRALYSHHHPTDSKPMYIHDENFGFMQRIQHFSDHIQHDARIVYEHLKKIDKTGSLLHTPLVLQKSLDNVPLTLANDMTYAHICGWIGYTILDDVIDGDNDDFHPSTAVIMLREVVRIYEKHFHETEFMTYVYETLQTIDDTMMWETMQCYDQRDPPDSGPPEWSPIKWKSQRPNSSKSSIPEWTDDRIAGKSIGHGLSSLALLYWSAKTIKNDDFRSLEKYFYHFLIARQLCDDMHDWQEDIASGFVNPVGAEVLRDAQKSKEDSEESNGLDSVFWHTTVDTICSKIHNHLNNAEKALDECSCIDDLKEFNVAVDRLRNVVEMTQHERDAAKDFLSAVG